jgi:hypothetical protein
MIANRPTNGCRLLWREELNRKISNLRILKTTAGFESNRPGQSFPPFFRGFVKIIDTAKFSCSSSVAVTDRR